MADPFLAEIRIVSFNFAPRGWAACNGQFLPINQNQALFALLGTTYGGNGQTTFALPDLRGRVPVHFGNGHVQGERAGVQAVTLTTQELPMHTHVVTATTNPANAVIPDNTTLLATPPQSIGSRYAQPGGLVAMHPASVNNVGGSQPHNNMAPYLVLNFVIALQGLFPSRN